MRNLLTFLILFLFVDTMGAQVVYQKGMTRRLNSGKEPISGVFIKFEDALSTNSDDNGKFTLTFQNKRAGDLIFLVDINKSGYELVNRKDFEVTKISNTDQLGVDIILAKTGVVDAAKKQYYEVSDKALFAAFEKEKRRLKAELMATKLDQKNYLDKLTNLQRQYESQQQSLNSLADKFARTNFDDVDEVYFEALQLFKIGKIDKCIQSLETADLIGRTNKQLVKLDSLSELKKNIESQLKRAIEPIQLLAKTYSLKFEFKKAEIQYEQLLLLDSDNLEILFEVADFYKERYNFNKTIELYLKVLIHPQIQEWQIANTYSYLGESYLKTRDYAKAYQSYDSLFFYYQKLYEETPNSPFYKGNLAVSYQFLGDMEELKWNYKKALKFHRKYNNLEEELYSEHPQNTKFKHGLAISYYKIGGIYSDVGKPKKASFYYEDFYLLAKELYEENPENIEFKNTLAVACQYKAQLENSLGNHERALEFYKNYYTLTKELYEVNPKQVNFIQNLAQCCYYLGGVYKSRRKKEKSFLFYKESEKLRLELVNTFPQHEQFQRSLRRVRTRLTEHFVEKIKKLISLEQDTLRIYELYSVLCDTLEQKRIAGIPCGVSFHDALKSKVWYGLELEKFAEVEEDIRKGMSINLMNHSYLIRKLPLTLLMQGKFEEAYVEYTKYKDQHSGLFIKNYSEGFLLDLSAYESNGTIPQDYMNFVEKIRILLTSDK